MSFKHAVVLVLVEITVKSSLNHMFETVYRSEVSTSQGNNGYRVKVSSDCWRAASKGLPVSLVTACRSITQAQTWRVGRPCSITTTRCWCWIQVLLTAVVVGLHMNIALCSCISAVLSPARPQYQYRRSATDLHSCERWPIEVRLLLRIDWLAAVLGKNHLLCCFLLSLLQVRFMSPSASIAPIRP